MNVAITTETQRQCSAALLIFLKKLVVVHVGVADELIDPFLLGSIGEGSGRNDPGACPDVGVFDRYIILKVAIFETLELLDNVKILRVHESVHLGFVVESDGVYDQRIAVPMTDGTAHPC